LALSSCRRSTGARWRRRGMPQAAPGKASSCR
jgi:hypothetical protein